MASDIDAIVEQYADGIHPSYEPVFDAVVDTAQELGADDPPAGLRAAVDKTVAYMANTDRPYTELEDEYGIGTSAVHNWLQEIQSRTDVDMQFNGYPRRILDAAVADAERLIREEGLGKMAAARQVAPLHGVGPASVKKGVTEEGRSKYDTDGTTDRLSRAVTRRPRTASELKQAYDLATEPGNYLGRRDDMHTIDHVVPPPDTDRISVWYTTGDGETARTVLAHRRAERTTDPDQNLPDFLVTMEEALDDGDVPVRDDWTWHWLWTDAAVRDAPPQHFVRIEHHLPLLTDYLLAYDDAPDNGGTRTYFTAEDVLTYNHVGDVDSRQVSQALTFLEETADVVDGFGGSPRKFDSRSIDEPGLLAFTTIADRYSQE